MTRVHLIAPLLLGLLCSACSAQLPYLMSATDGPVDREVRLGTTVQAMSCRSYLFGAIPLEPPYTSRALLDQARGRADLLVRISWDRRVNNYLLMTETCDLVYATQAFYVDGPTERVTRSSAASSRREPTARTDPSTDPDPTGPLADSGPEPDGLLLPMGDGQGADAILGLDGHRWGDPEWLGLRDIQVTPGRRLGTDPTEDLVIEGLEIEELQYGITNDGFSEIRFRSTESPVAALTRRLGPPSNNDASRPEWSGSEVQVTVRGNRVQIRRL